MMMHGPDPIPESSAENENRGVPQDSYGQGETIPEIRRACPYHRRSQQCRCQGFPDNEVQQFPGIVAGARPVSAGRKIGFELLGHAVFGLAIGALWIIGLIVLFNAFLYPSTYDYSYYAGYGGQMELVRRQVTVGFLLLLLTAGLLIGYWLVFLPLLLKSTGKTPGGLLGSYRTVGVADGANIGFGKALGYYMVYFLANFFVFGGLLIWLSPCFDSQSGWCRGWLEQMIDVVTVDTRMP